MKSQLALSNNIPAMTLTQDRFNRLFPDAAGKCVCAVLNKDWNTSGVAVVYPNGYVCQTWKEPAEADRFVHHSAITFDISY